MQSSHSSSSSDKTQSQETRPRGESFSDGQLSYAGRDVEELPDDLVTKYAGVTTRLDLSYNLFSRLPFLPRFSVLEELVVDNNELDDSLSLPPLPRLTTLSLNKNKIQDVDALLKQVKVKLPALTFLSLLGNLACPSPLSSADKDDNDYQRYRYLVIYTLPGLRFLDSTAVKDVERAEAKRVGPYTRIVRPQAQELATGGASPPKAARDMQPQYTPLPASSDDVEDPEHLGTFGKCKYVYYGRHSEGNRFIRNNDL